MSNKTGNLQMGGRTAQAHSTDNGEEPPTFEAIMDLVGKQADSEGWTLVITSLPDGETHYRLVPKTD